MKVSECRNCEYFEERKYSIRHQPIGYHAVGLTYRFGWCLATFQRCIDVKKKDCKRQQN